MAVWVVRGLSHPQELPLISAGSRRALAGTGACGQPGSRTANRMAVPLSPSIRERACPARPWPARTAAGYEQEGGNHWTYSAESTGRRTTTTSPSWTATGGLVARLRVSDDAAGLARLLDLLAEKGDSVQDPVPVAIETPRGLLVACLRAPRAQDLPGQPDGDSPLPDRHSMAGRKSDHGDAVVLANILRTDLHAHRPLPADSELAQAIAVLARAQQDAVWDRVAAQNKLRSHLREYFPGFLAAFAAAKGGIMRPEARAILAAAPARPTPRNLTLAQLRALLRKAGPQPRHRRRGAAAARRLPPGADAPAPLVEQAMGRQSLALLRQLDAACASAEDLEGCGSRGF